MTKVIGLVGRARSGKSTTAKSMQSEALSKGLKADIFEMSSYVVADLNTDLPKDLVIPVSYTRENIDPKELVKRGMSRRAEDPYYWVNLLNNDIRERRPDIAIIPNIRFLNEANFVRLFDGKLIRVLSLLRDGVEFISPDRDPNHQSETEHLKIEADFVLTNMRGKEKLLDLQARTLLRYILEG